MFVCTPSGAAADAGGFAAVNAETSTAEAVTKHSVMPTRAQIPVRIAPGFPVSDVIVIPAVRALRAAIAHIANKVDIGLY